MKKYLLAASIFIAFSSSAMTNDCKITAQMFKYSGTLINLATEKAKGPNATKLSQSTVTEKEFANWEKTIFSPRMAAIIDKYSQYKNVSSDNPIYLGNTMLIETHTYNQILSLYLSTKEEKYISKLKEIMARVGNHNEILKIKCSD